MTYNGAALGWWRQMTALAPAPFTRPDLGSSPDASRRAEAEPWFGLPWKTLLPILLLMAAVDAAVMRLSFKIPEGATGAMRQIYPPLRVFLLSLSTWCSFLPFLALAQRITLRTSRSNWAVPILAHAVAAIMGAPVYSLLQWCAYSLTTVAVAGWSETVDLMRQVPMRQHVAAGVRFISTYGAAALLTHYVLVRRLAAQREAQSLEMEFQLARAQLRMLRMQMEPHFLFNSLNGVLSLVREDPASCERMILSLTRFLRKTLEDEGHGLVPLERELDIVTDYLDIERHRFPDRFDCEIVASADARCQLVPALLLQPLVENAVCHGFSGMTSRGHLRISATLDGGRLRLIVEDDGMGPGLPPGSGHGLGLRLTRERLDRQFGDQATFEAGPGAQGGFRVVMTFPASV